MGENVDLPDPTRKSREEQMNDVAKRILKRRGVQVEEIKQPEPEPETTPYEAMDTKDLRLLLEERGVEVKVGWKRKHLIKKLEETEL